MQEYNWRKEREKFRPDFMKQPGAGETAPVVRPVVRRSAWWVPVVVILAILVVLAAAAGTFVWYRGRKKGGDSAVTLAQTAERYKSAVGLVVVTMELKDGQKFPDTVGTAWAFAPDKFATNAHVAMGLIDTRDSLKKRLALTIAAAFAKQKGCDKLEDFLEKLGDKKEEFLEACVKEAESQIRGFDASIVINGSVRKSYPVKAVQVHREYGVANTKFDPDVAVLTIEGAHDVYFKTAGEKTFAALKSGDPVAFLGFPMENLVDENVNIDNPVASMQSGIIVAVSDFDMKDSGVKGNYLIRHNLPTTGGASGSPIFNLDGEVIALVYAGNIIGQVKNGKVQRAPSAAQINFGVRSDLLEGMGKPVDIREFLAR